MRVGNTAINYLLFGNPGGLVLTSMSHCCKIYSLNKAYVAWNKLRVVFLVTMFRMDAKHHCAATIVQRPNCEQTLQLPTRISDNADRYTAECSCVAFV